MYAQLRFRHDRPEHMVQWTSLINKTFPIVGTRQGSRYTLIEKLTKMQHLHIIFALAKRVSTGKDCQPIVMCCCRPVLKALPHRKEQLQSRRIFDVDKGKAYLQGKLHQLHSLQWPTGWASWLPAHTGHPATDLSGHPATFDLAPLQIANPYIIRWRWSITLWTHLLQAECDRMLECGKLLIEEAVTKGRQDQRNIIQTIHTRLLCTVQHSLARWHHWWTWIAYVFHPRFHRICNAENQVWLP